MPLFLDAWKHLKEAGFIYPCNKSRKDVAWATQAPHTTRKKRQPFTPNICARRLAPAKPPRRPAIRTGASACPVIARCEFDDLSLGPCAFECLRDFGDFLVWRKDGQPAYELAVVVDDAAMGITEVVRGEDLLISTARQLLIYEALGLHAPNFTTPPYSATPADNGWPSATAP